GTRCRSSRSDRSLLDGLARSAGREPVGRRHFLEDHPHGLGWDLADVGDGLRDALGQLVLAVLAVSLVEPDVDEWHARRLLAESRAPNVARAPRADKPVPCRVYTPSGPCSSRG